MPPRRKLDAEFATTEDLMKAAGVARRTIAVWLDLDLLPKPTKISLGPQGGVFNRFPAWAVERSRFIAEKRLSGYTYEEIAAQIVVQERTPSEPQPNQNKSRSRRVPPKK